MTNTKIEVNPIASVYTRKATRRILLIIYIPVATYKTDTSVLLYILVTGVVT